MENDGMEKKVDLRVAEMYMAPMNLLLERQSKLHLIPTYKQEKEHFRIHKRARRWPTQVKYDKLENNCKSRNPYINYKNWCVVGFMTRDMKLE